MGAELSTARLKTLTDMGFTVAESRLALEATNGDVQRAAELLIARRNAREADQGGIVARRVNEMLREQRPWNEFFDRFLWPEHLQERIQTNLLYYRANYCIIGGGVALVGVLLQPALIVVAGLIGGIFFGAIEFGDTRLVPGINQRLTFEQRVCAAGMAASAVINYSGALQKFARIAVVGGGLVLTHAAFRARSLAARWSFFKDSVEKEAKMD